jgi:3-oxoacyl-[acyl-carrier protein] reductase
LGRAICLALSAEGAKVAVNSVRSDPQELLQRIAAEHGTKAIAASGDISRSEAVEEIFERTERALGPLDILINNAGFWPTACIRDISEEEWNRALAVNLTGAFLTSREAVRRWLAKGRRGRIVNVTSLVAFRGSTNGHAHYAAAKAGLTNFTVSLARETAPHGIVANAVAPGFMETEMAAEALAKDREKILSRIPLGRVGDPAEVAASVVFLASEKAGYITGATLHVNGGSVMQ